MSTLQPTRNGKKRGVNGSRLPAMEPAAGANTEPVFTASEVGLYRRMRFNPLRIVTPENLAMAHDNFDIGYLWQAALFWDAMIRRDDTLSFVVPQLENAIAAKPWAVFKKKDADETEAARHAAALDYFYGNVIAVDAFDRNLRGDRHLLLKQMGSSYAMRYAAHHFVWKREPGRMIEVEGAAPVPALTAEMEFVPLWFFENTTGQLRLLRFGGYGGVGEELDWEGEWMVTAGQGMMFSGAGCYIFKRLTFQDWTIFNERYAQQKVVGMTNAQKDSAPGRAMEEIVANFNGDQGIVLHECQATDKPPIALLGPEGTVSVDLFERFLERQDRKMTVMFRGSDLRNMSREKDTTGVSAQSDETEALEMAHCAAIASACRTHIDRAVIRYCFGEGVEPLAYFGLPGMDDEDAQQLRENAGFIADRGGRVDLANIADRLDVPLADESAEEEEVLQPMGQRAGNDPETRGRGDAENRTANSAGLRRLRELVEESLRTSNAFNQDEPRDEFGRWEATLPDEQWTGTPKEMHARADVIMRGFASVRHEKFGEVKFGGKGRDKTLFDKRTPHEFQSVQALPEMVANGTWVKSVSDREKNPDVVGYHTLHSGLRIGASRYLAEITLKETKSGGVTAHRFYLHRLHAK